MTEDTDTVNATVEQMIEQPTREWSIDNPDCPVCGSNDIQQLVIQRRNRTIVGSGDIIRDDYSTEFDLLEATCSSCETLLFRSDGYVALLEKQRQTA